MPVHQEVSRAARGGGPHRGAPGRPGPGRTAARSRARRAGSAGPRPARPVPAVLRRHHRPGQPRRAPCAPRECAGVTGVVLPRHRAVHVTPTVAKAAAGAIEHLPMTLVGGLPAALQHLSRARRVGSSGSTRRPTGRCGTSRSATAPVALVLGAEGSGLEPPGPPALRPGGRHPDDRSPGRSLNVACGGGAGLLRDRPPSLLIPGTTRRALTGISGFCTDWGRRTTLAQFHQWWLTAILFTRYK